MQVWFRYRYDINFKFISFARPKYRKMFWTLGGVSNFRNYTSYVLFEVRIKFCILDLVSNYFLYPKMNW